MRWRRSSRGDVLLIGKGLQEFIHLSFRKSFYGVGLGSFTFGQCGEFGGRLNDVWRQEDKELGFRVVLLRSPEEDAQQGEVAEDGDLGNRVGLISLHQAADNHGLAIGGNGDSVGGANVNDGGSD